MRRAPFPQRFYSLLPVSSLQSTLYLVFIFKPGTPRRTKFASPWRTQTNSQKSLRTSNQEWLNQTPSPSDRKQTKNLPPAISPWHSQPRPQSKPYTPLESLQWRTSMNKTRNRKPNWPLLRAIRPLPPPQTTPSNHLPSEPGPPEPAAAEEPSIKCFLRTPSPIRPRG